LVIETMGVPGADVYVGPNHWGDMVAHRLAGHVPDCRGRRRSSVMKDVARERLINVAKKEHAKMMETSPPCGSLGCNIKEMQNMIQMMMVGITKRWR
jgi:hypothetical protein